ncbi:alpha/beta hydrolase [Streptomyces sp. URMC 123]|uniref:alpha/beta hydrolase n=1 Tax=Streptomyces sp. URMC 123 TaxID=3423403 RepID=UPI003F1C7451
MARADAARARFDRAEERGTAIAAARAAAAGIAFGPCPEADRLPSPVECGTVSVPLDYARPYGPHIRLTVSRVRATGAWHERQGALVFNPGGPGGSGMHFPLYAAVPQWRNIARAYDFVGYAPRGVGRSAPLSCQDPAEFTKAPTNSPAHPDAAYKEQRKLRAQEYARGCERATGPALRHYTSIANARDLEVIRGALRQEELSFLGASYGTYFGSVYATLFPDRVRRMVLDSAVNPDPAQIWYRNNLDQSLAFETRWADWRRWVAKHHDTYRLGRTEEEVLRSFERAVESVERAPAGGRVGSAQLRAAFLKAAYYDDVWAHRAGVLSAYLRGDPEPLVETAAPRPEEAAAEENGNAVYTAVECNDAPWPRDWATWDQDNTRLARLAPFETWDNAWMNLPCAYWGPPRRQPVDVRTEADDTPPVLILAAERDAATPYRGALELHRRLAGSTLVTERGAGSHGLSGGSNACVNHHVEAYLLHGRTQAKEVECAARAEPRPEPVTPAATPRAVPRPALPPIAAPPLVSPALPGRRP